MPVHRIAHAALSLHCFAMGAAWAGGGLFSSREEPEFPDPVAVLTLTHTREQGDEYMVQGHMAGRSDAAGVS